MSLACDTGRNMARQTAWRPTRAPEVQKRGKLRYLYSMFLVFVFYNGKNYICYGKLHARRWGKGDGATKTHKVSYGKDDL